MPKISWHSYDIAVVAVRQDHTSSVSVLKVYRPWALPFDNHQDIPLEKSHETNQLPFFPDFVAKSPPLD